MSETIDFKQIAAQAMQVISSILADICPGGKQQGKEYIAGSVSGGEGRSLSFNMHSGQWADFSTSEKGGDVISFYAASRKMTQKNAAIEIQTKYLGKLPITFSYPVPQEEKKIQIIKPPINAEPPTVHENNQMWTYRDEKGYPVFYVIRGFNPKENKKFYYPMTFAENGEWTKRHYPKPFLYNLDRIVKKEVVPKTGELKNIVICEGEKAAEAAQKILGNAYIATTWPAGVNNWSKCDYSPLTGRKVLLWPDADTPHPVTNVRPGIKAMSEIGLKLSKICAEIKLINTDASNKVGGWDAADALAEGWDFGKFATWAKPILQVFELPKLKQIERVKAEVVKDEPKQEKKSINVDDLIPSDEFPVPPNLKILYGKLGLQFGQDDKSLVMNSSNVAKIIRHEIPNLVWRDEFYNANMTKMNVPEGEPGREWTEDDTNNLAMIMQTVYGMAKINKSAVQDAINYIACLDIRNEPQDWLHSLKWDGVKRIDEFFICAMASENNDWAKALGRNFWISLAARVLEPGCQVDEMVILESVEGTRKTSALREIGGKWYGEVNSDLRSKDFDQGLVGKILIEFGELSEMKKSDVELVKRKITSKVDQYRPSYGRRVEKFPRTCIFVGTTNEREYLQSTTGNRRFNPLPVGKVDIVYIKENRDQLFAEAVARFYNHESWWEYPEMASEIRESRRQVDEWESVIQQIINGPRRTTHIETHDIWTEMGGTIEKLDRPTQLRIGKIMRKLGYEKSRVRLGAVQAYSWIKL